MNLVEFFSYSFIIRALIAGLFIGSTCAVLGTFLVLRRLSLIGDGLAHLSFGTVALGMWLGIYPFAVSLPLVILGSLLVFLVTEKARLYGDVAIGIISAFGIAGGVIIASVSGGFNVDLFSYLFGNILSVTTGEVIMTVLLSMIVLGILMYFYRDLVAITYDQEHAQVTGISVQKMNAIFVMLTGAVVVLAIRVVGVMLISAMLILPPVTAFQISRGFRSTLVTAALVAVLAVVCGTVLSFIADLPTGATIVMVNLLFFLLAWGRKLLLSR